LQVVIRSNLLCLELQSLEDVGSTQCNSDNTCRAVASTSSAAAAAAAAIDNDDNDSDDNDYDDVEPEGEQDKGEWQANAASRPNEGKYSKYVM